MKIGRFIKSSLSEWKGKNSCVIEVRGSAVRSPYLTPSELFDEDGPAIDESEILEYITEGRTNLEAISISGGEPLMQKDLYPFLKKARTLKLPILLRTEGTCPDALDDLVGACMVDRASVKVVRPPADMKEFGSELTRTLAVLGDSGMDYEVEIVAVPGITVGDTVEGICRLLKGKATVTISRFDISRCNDPALRDFKKKEILGFVSAAKKYVKKVELKGF